MFFFFTYYGNRVSMFDCTGLLYTEYSISRLSDYCHDFCRSQCLSLFGRCSAVDVASLLAIADPFFIFHLLCLVWPHTWFSFPSLCVVYLTLCFPNVFVWYCLSVFMYAHVGLGALGYVQPVFVFRVRLCRVFLVRQIKSSVLLPIICSPAPDFLQSFTHTMTDYTVQLWPKYLRMTQILIFTKFAASVSLDIFVRCYYWILKYNYKHFISVKGFYW